MFSDMGSISLWLGIFFILLSLSGIFIIYSIIKNKSIENENIDKIIELGKWFIVSVAITLSVSIVNDGFRERDQDIKEMEVFEKHINTILEASGVEKRKLLCEYFAAVSPEGPIKKSWKEYKTIVDQQVVELRAAEKKVNEITGKAPEQRSEADNKALLDAGEKAAILSQSLKTPDVQEWIIIAGADSSVKAALDEVKKFKELRYSVGIYKKENSFRTVVGPFQDKNAGLVALVEVREIRKDSYLVNLKTWCKNSERKDSFVECTK
ncbi:hypothetical protein R5L37_10550 [Acinetobacter pittii]|uniref:hypothetical protein n=1 Tax=Acinetobacter pittii TaxID=48296 RepID=UPI0029543313|nr:hypothetical protein [Acinetobacter pittii]MDV8152201.1 hypothetical protein [Acinetobacter pittii]